MKGARTVIADSQQVWLNLYGNDGMAAGGSGDVLTGIIGSLLAQGAEPADAAKAGVLLHALAGDAAAAGSGKRSMKAGDLVTFLPNVLRTCN
jgi:NAD(P)H-hydrate epimerase